MIESMNRTNREIMFVYSSFKTGPPDISETPGDLSLLEGSTATFTCTAEARPLHTAAWEFEGIALTNSEKYTIRGIGTATSTLNIHNVSLSDAGQYICITSNDHGNESTTAQLHVYSKVLVP